VTTPTDEFIDAYHNENDPDKRRDLLLHFAHEDYGRAGAYRYLAAHLLMRLDIALRQRDHARRLAESYRRPQDAAVPWEVEQ